MDGHSYERAAIEGWFSNHNTSPSSNKKLSSKQLVTNYALRSAIQAFIGQHAVKK
jgi:U-box domain